MNECKPLAGGAGARGVVLSPGQRRLTDGLAVGPGASAGAGAASASRFVECPVCAKSIPHHQAEAHVEGCLARQGAHSVPKHEDVEEEEEQEEVEEVQEGSREDAEVQEAEEAAEAAEVMILQGGEKEGGGEVEAQPVVSALSRLQPSGGVVARVR